MRLISPPRFTTETLIAGAGESMAYMIARDLFPRLPVTGSILMMAGRKMVSGPVFIEVETPEEDLELGVKYEALRASGYYLSGVIPVSQHDNVFECLIDNFTMETI